MGDYLAPGFRFYPTEQELVSFYLYHKLHGGTGTHHFNRLLDQIIPVLNIYLFNPWDLPQFAGEVCKRDEEQWFFFIPRQESEARGGRPKRVTDTGYWKATGSPSFVYSSSNSNNNNNLNHNHNHNHSTIIRSIGVKRSMVFYNGRAPKGTKTHWKMNEYKLFADHHPTSFSTTTTIPQLSLCRIYKKSKSLRAFDRRPPPPPIASQIPTELQLTTTQHNNVGDHEFVDDNKLPNPPLMDQEIKPSSPESFTSGDHQNINGESEATASNKNNNMQIMKMKVDNNELVWDWNHLNWL